jgi:hypothetical protein
LPFRSRTEASAAAHKSWAFSKDRRKRTDAARAAQRGRTEREVDPDREMSAKAVENLRKWRQKELSAKGVAARQARAAQRRAEA